MVAAYSASLSRRATLAALEAAQEARRARRDQILPRLILEREFFELRIQWPHRRALKNEPVLAARRDWRTQEEFSPPTFSLSNYGENPALDALLTFQLEDPNGDLQLSEAWGLLGIHSGEGLPADSAGGPGLYCRSEEKEWGAALATCVTVLVPSCPPGRPRTIEFPYDLAGTIFLRGLQHLDRQLKEDKIKPLILTVLVSYHTIEAERLKTQFRFKICPAARRQAIPARVVVKVDDLAMYPQPNPEPAV